MIIYASISIIMSAIKKTISPFIKKRKVAGRDIILNVSFQDSMIRFGAMVLLPIVVLMIDKNLVIYTAPILAYLFITALTQFCIIKYIWHRYIKHEPEPVETEYGKDPHYPEESV
jgi:hypothetical protein